ncbi:MAG TPA: hypothetical protein DD727_04365 [Clostridiales bacterium]|nr:hypothetical protein [Clostridiales bacterium]
MKNRRNGKTGNREGFREASRMARVKKEMAGERGALGVDQILAITAAVIVVGLVLIPGLRTFGENIISQMQTWWTNISATIFASS